MVRTSGRTRQRGRELRRVARQRDPRGRNRRTLASSASNRPSRAPTASTRSRTLRAAAAWRSGRSRSGRRGIATSRAACAGSSASGGTPNQASEPARTPSRLPPNGASVSQMSRMPLRPNRASSWMARAISISLERSVRGRGSSRRAACMARVEPPETTWPARTNWHRGTRQRDGIDAGVIPEPPVLHRDQQVHQRRARPVRRRRGTATRRRTPGSSASGLSCRSTISVPTDASRDRSGGNAQSSSTAIAPRSQSSEGSAAIDPATMPGLTIDRFVSSTFRVFALARHSRIAGVRRTTLLGLLHDRGGHRRAR